MITSIKGLELQAGEETVDYLVSSQLDAEMLTPADTDSQISSEHVTVSNFQDSANLFICIAIWICPKVGYSQIN